MDEILQQPAEAFISMVPKASTLSKMDHNRDAKKVKAEQDGGFISCEWFCFMSLSPLERYGLSSLSLIFVAN